MSSRIRLDALAVSKKAAAGAMRCWATTRLDCMAQKRFCCYCNASGCCVRDRPAERRLPAVSGAGQALAVL